MSLSLGEIETAAKKAARGAGYPWGLAEEAGFATRWLCAQGLDGCAILNDLLHSGLAADLAQHRPTQLGDTWQGADQLCPITTGAAFTDSATILLAHPICLRRVAAPMLLLPFVAQAAARLHTTLSLQCGALTCLTTGDKLGRAAPLPVRADQLTIFIGGTLSDPRRPALRAHPEPATWDALTALAKRTYAPATEASRRLGAGAGQTDND